jgi:hypothetical protein
VAAQGRQKEKKKTDGVFGEAVSFNTSLEKITSRPKLDDTTDIDASVSLPTSRAASASEDRTANTCDFTRKLRPEIQKHLSEATMPLRKMQVEHFVRFRFGADNSDEVVFLFTRPSPQVWRLR